MTRIYLKEGDMVNCSATTFNVMNSEQEHAETELQFDGIGDGAEIEFWSEEYQAYFLVREEVGKDKVRMYYEP